MTAKPVEIVNLDCPKYNKSKARNANINLPKHPFRAVFVGSSNSGKTNVLVNLMLKHLAFDKCFIICPNASIQPKYLLLKDKMAEVDEAVKKQLLKKVAEYNRTHKTKKIDPDLVEVDPICEFHEEMPLDLLDQLDPKNQNILVFDDCLLNSRRDQEIMCNAFVRGRHRNTSVITLAQSFYKVPRVLRLQANWFVIFHSTNQNELVKLHRECGSNIDKKEFVETIMNEIKPRYHFVTIDLDDPHPYRRMNFVDHLFS